MEDTGTYLVVVAIGFLLTVVVGQVLIRAGKGFLVDVFEDKDTAQSVTWLLAVLFHLVALGFLALISTVVPFEVEGTVQRVVTKLGGVLLILGVLHGGTLLLLSRVRNRRRSQGLEASMTQQYEEQRRSRQQPRTQVIEAGGSSGGATNSGR